MTMDKTADIVTQVIIRELSEFESEDVRLQ